MRLQLFLIAFFAHFVSYGQLISTFAGNGTASFGGDGGLANNATIGYPSGGAFDSQGNYYFPIRLHNRVRKVATSGIITTICGNGNAAFSGDGGPALNAELNAPIFVAVDSFDNIYICDANNQRIRKITATTGIITTIAGNGVCDSTGDGGLAINASICGVTGIDFDSFGNLYICDYGNHKVRKVNTSGYISTIAGDGSIGFSGDGGVAINAQLHSPRAVAIDHNNNLFIADWLNQRVRKVDFNTNIISTVIGNGTGSFSGDSFAAISAGLNPVGLDFNKTGELFIADYSNNRIRKVDNSNIIYTVAGVGTAGYNGDNMLATASQLYQPEGVALDTCGNLYIADKSNKRIRKVTFDTSCGETNTAYIPKFTSNSSSIYPNPANTQITVAGNSLTKVSITNSIGQVVLNEKIRSQRTIVDISSFDPGIYFVVVTDVEGNKRTEKLIKE